MKWCIAFLLTAQPLTETEARCARALGKCSTQVGVLEAKVTRLESELAATSSVVIQYEQLPPPPPETRIDWQAILVSTGLSFAVGLTLGAILTR